MFFFCVFMLRRYVSDVLCSMIVVEFETIFTVVSTLYFVRAPKLK